MFYMVLRILVIAACCTAAGMHAVRILQARRYQIPALATELKERGGALSVNVLTAVGATLVNWYLPVLLSMAIQKEGARETLSNYLMLALFLLTAAIQFLHARRASQRRPFVWSQRIVRLMTLVFLLNALIAVLLNLLTLSPYLAYAAADYTALIAAALMNPVEERINARYYKAARKKLAAARNLICIGVTGSYGKTETKMILATLLAEKYRVLVTPPSFSTVMGAARTVNEQLRSGHQVFIAEMGAQKKGEIREIARLVRPKYALLTCIGPAHLDSFGSMEAIAQAKYELIRSIPEDGAAFFGADGGFGERLYALCKSEKYLSGVEAEGAYMRAEQVEITPNGMRFALVCADGERARIQTPLLGGYAVRNIALAASVARRLGLSMEQIAQGAAKLKPLRHHMQRASGKLNVIDDSENALPDAAAEALKVLGEFPGRRILVTTGFGASESAEADYAYGTQIAASADYVILIDPEGAREVMRGLMSTGYPKASVRMVRSEADAAALLQERAAEGDSVLYEGVYPWQEE